MSEALRLAEWLAGEACGGSNWNKNAQATAAELRRLHAENERLREALHALTYSLEDEVFLHDDQRNAFATARAILK